MPEKKKEERTLEMRVAELEELLGVRAEPIEFTEEEVAAYNKIADALGVEACRIQSCRLQPCRYACRTYPCLPTCRTYPCLPPCRAYPCRVQTCRIPGGGNSCRHAGYFQQCIDQCFACYAGDYEVDFSGGFGTLGY